MDGKSLNLTQELLEQLQAIIPQAFSEGKLDTTALKTLLGEEVFVQGERYGLSWAGKSDAYKVLQQQTTTTLIPEPEQSVDWDNAQHVFIEGENLEVLKLLQKSYFGQVKMIYIDPPYNTGSDSFIYPDKFSETKEEYLQRIGDKNDEGYMLRQGAFRPNRKESGQYHSNWLNMMLPRLYLARNLLREDGVIFVSIDDNEAANLKLLMDEVFGAENFIAQVVWQRAFSPKSDAKFLSENHDYVLLYAKHATNFNIGLLERTDEANARYKNIDNDSRGVWISDNLTVKTYSEKYDYSIVTPSGRNVSPSHGSCWRVSKEKLEQLIDDNRIWFGEDGGNVPRLKRFLSEVQDGMVATTLWLHKEVGHNQEGRQELKELFDGKGYFDGPKPIRLLSRIFKVANTQNNDIILDFFAGSGTTAQAVMELNEEDGGNRRYICVQLPEKTEENSEAAKAGYATIADITAARIKKVIDKIKLARPKENDGGADCRLGFRKFTLAPSNFKLWRGDVIDSEEELLRQMRLFATPQRATATTPDMAWELLLKSGLSLTDKVTVIWLADGLKVYTSADKSLALVLDGFNAAVQAAVLKLKPKQLILLDSVFAGQENGDSLKTNAQLTFEDQGIAFKTV